MSGSEFYHEALVRRIRDRDDCDDDLRGACDEIEDCYEAIGRLEAQIERLRPTDEDREAIKAAIAYMAPVGKYDSCVSHTLRNLLERLGGERWAT